MIDVTLPYTHPTKSPHIAEFTERILSQLKPLIEGDEEIQNHVVEENGVGEQDERTQAIRLLKTVLKWLMASAGRSFSTPVPQQLQLLPLLFKVSDLYLYLSVCSLCLIFYPFVWSALKWIADFSSPSTDRSRRK